MNKHQFTFNFNAPIEHMVAHLDHQVNYFGKDAKMQIMSMEGQALEPAREVTGDGLEVMGSTPQSLRDSSPNLWDQLHAEEKMCPYLDLKKIEDTGLMSADEVEDKIREAVLKKQARYLVAILKKYEMLYLDFGKDDKKTIYNSLKSFFGDDIKYKYPNFITEAKRQKFHCD